tara:strand:- start:4663 stop:6063 length:1401 start_codon:yes stop_codon:yes gene_type:complete
MNINQKENAEISPINPPSGAYSFRGGFPIVQFQIANQNKLLDPSSLRLNGRFKLLAPVDANLRAPLTNDSAVPVANSRTGININNRVGIASAIHQMTISAGGTNQTLETVRSYGRYLASVVPVTHSQSDFDMTNQVQNPASASRSFNGAHALNNEVSFSIPLRSGLLSGQNFIPLGAAGVNGLQLQLELAADSSVISGYSHYSTTDVKTPILFNPPNAGAFYELADLTLSYNLYVPDEAGQNQMSMPSTGSLSYNSISQLYSVLNSSDQTKVLNLGTSNTLSVFHNFIPTNQINNYAFDSFSTGQLQNSGGSPAVPANANLQRVTFIRGGLKFPLEYDIEVQEAGEVNRPQTMNTVNFINSIKPYKFFNHSLMSTYTNQGIIGTTGFEYEKTPRNKNTLPEPNNEVFGVGISFDPLSKVGVDFRRSTYGVRLVSELNDSNSPNSIFTYVRARNTLTYSPAGIAVTS